MSQRFFGLGCVYRKRGNDDAISDDFLQRGIMEPIIRHQCITDDSLIKMTSLAAEVLG